MKNKTAGEISLLNFIDSQKIKNEIVKSNNKAIEQGFLSRISKLSNHKIKSTTVNDAVYFEPIVELSTKQKSNFKNLLDNGHN